MKISFPDQGLVDATAQCELAKRVEAGVYAKRLLDEDNFGTHSRSELELVVQDGIEAREHWFRANLRLVAKLSRIWGRRYCLDPEELFQEGCLGLGEAIWRYDYLLGTRFSTVAWRLIANKVAQAALNRCGQIEAPSWRLRMSHAVWHLASQLAAETGQVPTIGEIALILGRSEVWVADLQVVGMRFPLIEEVDLVVDASKVSCSADLEVKKCLSLLSSLEREVISSRYGLDGNILSVADLASRLGVSESTIRRVETRAIDKLRQRLVDSKKVAEAA